MANTIARDPRRRSAGRRRARARSAPGREHADRSARRGAERLGIRTGLDVLKMIDVAEDVVRPVMDDECLLDRLGLIMGYAGVYSSFLKHAYRAAERYDVSGAEILLECGERKLVGGQEDQIIRSPSSCPTPTSPTLAPACSQAKVSSRQRPLRRTGRHTPRCDR